MSRRPLTGVVASASTPNNTATAEATLRDTIDSRSYGTAAAAERHDDSRRDGHRAYADGVVLLVPPDAR